MLICLLGSGKFSIFHSSLLNSFLFLGEMVDSAAKIVSFVGKKVTVFVIFLWVF